MGQASGMMGGGGGGGGVPISQIAASVGGNLAANYSMNELDAGSRAQIRSQREANALYRDLYSDTQADYQPYQQAGTSALDALLRTYGLAEGQNGQADYSGFENSPDYLWAQQQGIKGQDMSAASTGRLYSGNYAQALAKYNQGLATQHLGNYRSGLGNLSSQGLNATNALSNYRMGYGNQLGTGLTNIGDIRMANRLGHAGIINNLQSQKMDIWGMGGGQQQQQPFSMPSFSPNQSTYGTGPG